MENLQIQQLLKNLEYGIIYVCGNPKQTHNLRWFATMIQPMIRPMSIKWVETWDVDHTLIVARRFNVGNIGRYATVQLHMNGYGQSSSYSMLAAVHAFSDCLSDVMDGGQGDVLIQEKDYSDRNELPKGKWGTSATPPPIGEMPDGLVVDAAPQDHTRVSTPRHFDEEILLSPSSATCVEEQDEEPSIFKRFKKLAPKRQRRKKDTRLQTDVSIDECVYGDNLVNDEKGGLQDLEAEEVKESSRIESEYERDVRDLRTRIVAFIAKYHQDPRQVMTTMLEGKVLLGQEPGRLLVNGDMKIVLPDYDEMEIKMSAMCRTLYILFMKRRVQGNGGFELRNIDQFRDEIVDIYCLVKPGANEERVCRSVDNLCDPYSNALNETISKVNGFIKKCIPDRSLQQQYLITGVRGGEYAIGLSPEMMSLPRAVL